MRLVRQYLDVYRTQIKNNLVRQAVYRTNFLASLTTDLIWIAIELSLFTILYGNVNVLAGWTEVQVYFFLGIFFASDALFTTFFQNNFWTFSDLVQKGELDILLTKPVHPLFLTLSKTIDLTSILNFFLGIGIAIRYSGPAGFPGGLHWLELPLWLAVGVYTAIQIRFFSSVWVFWTDRSWALSRMYYQFFTFATKPDALYPKTIRYVLLTALPFAFIGSIPTRALLHELRPWEYANVLVVLVGLTGLNLFLWNRGLKRYQSASS
jgi:ABC-2 type transport system permease protein